MECTWDQRGFMTDHQRRDLVFLTQRTKVDQKSRTQTFSGYPEVKVFLQVDHVQENAWTRNSLTRKGQSLSTLSYLVINLFPLSCFMCKKLLTRNSRLLGVLLTDSGIYSNPCFGLQRVIQQLRLYCDGDIPLQQLRLHCGQF